MQAHACCVGVYCTLQMTDDYSGDAYAYASASVSRFESESQIVLEGLDMFA